MALPRGQLVKIGVEVHGAVVVLLEELVAEVAPEARSVSVAVVAAESSAEHWLWLWQRQQP